MEKILFNGKSDNCCAYCNFHQCAMTVKQMRIKECLRKECKYFEKREEHQIWKQREVMKEKRKARKALLAAV